MNVRAFVADAPLNSQPPYQRRLLFGFQDSRTNVRITASHLQVDVG